MVVPGTDPKYEDRAGSVVGTQRYAVTSKCLGGVLLLVAIIASCMMNYYEKIVINITFSTPPSMKQKEYVAAAVTENKKDAGVAAVVSKVEAKKKADEVAVVNVTSGGILVIHGDNDKSQDVRVHSMKRQRPHPPKGSSCIYFDHVPKCGGTSTRMFLENISKQLNYTVFNWYGGKNGTKRPNGYCGERLPLLDRTYNKNAINSGHLAPHPFIRLAKQQACYIFTVLREPIDRSISLFYYNREKWKDWDDFVEKVPSRSYTVRFSQEGCIGRECSCTVNKENGLDCDTDVTKFRFNVDAANQIARQLLLDYDLVCFQDDLHSCSIELKKLIGHPSLSGEIPKVNVGKKRHNSTVSSEINLEKLKGTLIENDILLYNWARDVFYS